MLRKSGLFFVAAALLWGCDLFSTREMRFKPSDLRTLNGLYLAGDSVTFRVSESIWKQGAKLPEQQLSRRRLVFTFLGDSVVGSATLKRLSLKISDDSSGAVYEVSERLVNFTTEGVVLSGRAIGGGEGGGVRFFPLKTSSAENATGILEQAGDSTSFLTLPALLIEGWNTSQRLGILEVRREQTVVDTLNFQGHLEEAWGVSESVIDPAAGVEENVLAKGMFWYGASGLLKAEQIWINFTWRDKNGTGFSKPDANGNFAEVELHRTLERL